MKRNRSDWENEDNANSTESSEPVEKHVVSERKKCPFLDTINRNLLDFDSEKLCSQTLSNRNVYVCLVCGKFFEGRGKSTPAYTHCLQLNHYVFMNLESGRTYCLPDGYEVIDSSLEDIKLSLCPTYTIQEITKLDNNGSLSRDVHGVSYLPGFMGLNNLNATDDVNVILHLLGHVSPFRDFFLQPVLYSNCSNRLVLEFGLILRKLWSSTNFKCTVSPQELVQMISIESKRAFSIGLRSEALDLFVWLLNYLQKGIDPKSKHPFTNSILMEPFQGVVEVTTCKKVLVDNYEEQKLLEKIQKGDAMDTDWSEDGWKKSVTEVPFTFLSLDIPPCPLFRDSQGGFVIPQVPLFQLLAKFDGSKWNDQVTKEAHLRKQYRIRKLPRYLILHLMRFQKNNFSLEKNPTIVTFPVRNLEMKDYLYPETTASSKEIEEKLRNCPSKEVVLQMSVEDISNFIRSYGAPLHVKELQSLETNNNNYPSLEDLRCIAERVLERIHLFSSTKYDLVANICHESEGGANGIAVGDLATSSSVYSRKRPAATADSENVVHRGKYKIHLQCRATDQWYEIEDLRVSETTPQLIGVSESYILVYEKK